MTREVSFGRAKVVVIPQNVFDAAEREFDAGRAEILVIYPDNARSQDVVEIFRLALTARGQKAETTENEP